MHVESIEVYASDSNFTVLRPPGRRYPGCVIQGDSLAILWSTAKWIAEATRERRTETVEFRAEVECLTNSLIGRILHYQSVLDTHGIELPSGTRFTAGDLCPEADDL
jgi:hypothetical protein